MDGTPLDRAHAAMEAAPEDEAARLRFHERLADAELFLLLAAEAEGGRIAPRLFELEEGPVALAFDREARLAAFLGAPAPYAALSGRALVVLLAEAGLGLGLNFGAPSQYLLPREAVAWLAGALAGPPEEAEGRPEEVSAPRGLPERVVEALAVKLASAEGLAGRAYLASVRYEGGRRGHLLAFLGAVPGAEAALAQAVNEALIFSGIEAGGIDVAFLAEGDPAAAAFARAGLGFDIPVPPEPAAPDPARPPRLR